MGAFHTNVIIRNLADPGKSWEEFFLVVTGAAELLFPSLDLKLSASSLDRNPRTN